MTLAKRSLGQKRAERPGLEAASAAAARKPPQPDPAALLSWYDRHRRVLPWRARPGEPADPYKVWISEIMLQQTTVRAVAPFYARFLARFPSVGELAAAPLDDVLRAWAGLGYYARARNLHACAKAVCERFGGEFPRSESELRALPGIGAYTAAAIAAIAFDQPAMPVDGNIERVVARLFAIEEELPAAKPSIRVRAEALRPPARCGDFAQALMDLGAAICTPKNPACVVCPWCDACAARARGDPERFPRKSPKAEGRLRRGAAFVLVRGDGMLLLRNRPERGLLGGMAEVPGTDWSHDFTPAMAFDPQRGFLALAGLAAPQVWRRLPSVVRHVFTHFPLELAVFYAQAPDAAAAPPGLRWAPLHDLAAEALPNVMRKVIAHALDLPPAQTQS